MAYVYILELSSGQYYIGSTLDIDRRLLEHQSGCTKSIRYKLPCRLAFQCELGSVEAARKAESFIKKQKSKVFTEKVISGALDIKLILGGR